MELSEIKNKIKDYLSNSFHLNALDDSSNIFEVGGLNSLFFIQLLVFIEKTFNLQLEEGEFNIRSLTSVNAISEFLSTKLSHST
jgi:methoxymalonate biosynthesis acyl carrier protein